MTSFAHILNLSHVNSAGADPLVFHASTSHNLDLAAGNVQHVPCLASIKPASLLEEVVDGFTVKAPTPPRSVEVTLARFADHSGKTDRLAPLAGRVIIGQTAGVGAVGTGADGTSYTVAAPLVLYQGKVVELDDQDDKLVLTVQPVLTIHQRTLPDKALLGYRSAIQSDGVDDVVVISGYTAMPTVTTLMARAIVAKTWGVGASDTQTLWATRALEFGLELTNGYKVSLFVKYTTDAGGTQQKVSGPEFTPEERDYGLTVVFDSAAGGGGVTARFGVDGVFFGASHATAFHSLTEAWQMLRYRSDNTTVLGGIIYAALLFSAAVTDADLTTLVNTRARGDETNLALYYPGEVGLVSGDLLDLTVANQAAPLDGTITGAIETSAFEGPVSLAGTRLPLIFAGQHMPLGAVDHERLIYRTTNQTAVNYLSRVMEGGADFTVTPRYSVKDFVANAPAVGEAAICPWMGGLVRFEALADNAALAADVSGCSAWEEAMVLGKDHGDSYVSFPVSMAPGDNGFVFDLWFEWRDSTGGVGLTVFGADWADIGKFNGVSNNTFFALVHGTTGAISLSATIPQTTVAAVRIEAWNDVGDMRARLLLNGKVVDSGFLASRNLKTEFTASPFLGALNVGGTPLFQMEHVAVLPMRLWEPGEMGATDAEAEANQREWLFENPPSSDPDLLGMWFRTTTSISTLDDEVGSNDGTLGNPGTFGRSAPGLCWSDPLAACVYTLRDKGGFNLADIIITEAAWQDIEPAAQNLWIPEPTNVGDVAHKAIGPGYVFLKTDETAVLGVIVEATEANSSGTLTAAEVMDIMTKTGKRPPSKLAARWGQIMVTQEALASADSERRALMSALYREELIPIGDNAVVFADEAFPQGVTLDWRGWYRDREPTIRRLDALALIWHGYRPVYDVPLKGGHRAMTPGEIWGITNPKTGDVIYVMVMKRESSEAAEVWTVR